MSVAAQNGAALPAVDQRQVMGAVVASCLGWALDLFDLFVLLFVAPVVGRLFFPSEHAMLSLAAVYASFAVTLLMRPLGSAWFGSYADRHGRKGAMITAVVGVGLSTAAFGLLPTVAQVGLVAPILFLMLRLVQGVFVGGVVASTHTIGTESVAPKYRGAVSGLIGGGGAGLGALLASLTYLTMSAIFPGELFDVWGWRCMFFTGIVSSILGLFVFSSLEESPLWKKLAAEKAAKAAMQNTATPVEVVRSPIRTLFSRDYRSILFVNLLLTIGGGSGYYLTSGYLPTFLKVVSHAPNGAAAAILMICSVAVVIASIAAGHLSTFIGRKSAFVWIGLIRLIALPALFLLLPTAQSITMIGVYAVILSALGSAGYAPILIFLNERFPTAIRATGTGLSWNIGFAIGGMMPTAVSLVAKDAGQLPMTLAIFAGAISVIFLAGAFIVPETRGKLDNGTAHEAA
ncbi:MFS transporter [Paraburkholderia fungorum]|uniref:MFS transporter n=1 Tax=Paraburkholderia fungorum TaxID=134537 RepID=UPI0004815B80|nr:MFS transporter [Paraburkholderia fungorum]KFX61339.1 MFS transporter [Burkholderia sp. K24]MBB5543646.1 MFS family permease [Paraburkholderia fungorum]PNE56555.1 MFS transporter [Paraburkholderia fungorum]USX07105.1 MFS transporter [Paraburkholderia fungorum]